MSHKTWEQKEAELQNLFAHTTLDSWSALSSYQKPSWIFRGHHCSVWSLQSSLDRLVEKLNIQDERICDLERDLMREFRRVYYRYTQHIPIDTMEWLSNMQHHGAPTRLLDCTYSIFVAAYFAIEKATREAAVWAFNSDWLLNQSIYQLEAIGHEDASRLHEKFDETHSALIDRWFFDENLARCAVPLNAFRLNERLAVQRGVFLCQGDPRVDFEANLMALDGHDVSENVLRIRIPIKERAIGLSDLFTMNITRSSLFPGLDGFAESLGIYHPLYTEYSLPYQDSRNETV